MQGVQLKEVIMEKWWHESRESVAGKLVSDAEQGLTPREAAERLEKYGSNVLAEKPGRSPVALFFDQFKDFIIWVLIVAALVSGFLQEWVDALAIIGIVIINAILGFIQEYRAEKSLSALKKLSSPNSKVIRDGIHLVVPSSEIVPEIWWKWKPGIMFLPMAVLCMPPVTSQPIEASLTGESTPVAKTQPDSGKRRHPVGRPFQYALSGNFSGVG